MVSDAEQLATWRTIGARYSEQVLDLAPRVLKSGGLGEQGKLPYTNVSKLITRMGSEGTIGHRSHGYGTYINCKGKRPRLVPAELTK
jgi:hypothetical protein